MNFEEISKKVKKFSKDTMTEVQKMNEVRQLNGKVNEEKKYLNRLYLEMGKKLYDKYKEEETAPEGFEAEFRKIRERYSVMDLLQDEIRKVKGVVLCPCCNMEVAQTERFCSNCGNRMPEPVKIEGKEDADVIDSADGENEEADAQTPSETVVDVEAEEVTETVTVEDTNETEADAGEAAEEEVTEEISGADAGEAAEEVLEEAEETSEEIPVQTEEVSEEMEKTVSEDKTDEVAAKADEAAAAKAAEFGEKESETKE